MAGAMRYTGYLVLFLCLLFCATAAGQLHDYTRPRAKCSQSATIAVAMLAGPVNYLRLHPRISCRPLPPAGR